MADDPTGSKRPTEVDRDTVDVTWLATLARRVGRRIMPEPEPDGQEHGATARSLRSAQEPSVEPDDTKTAPTPTDDARPRWARLALTYGLPLALAVAVGVLATINHFSGPDWGDDFALYVRQAKALIIGNVGEVLHDNRYAIDNSGWHTFSPYSYPWGWPLLMAPFYAVFGMNYAVFKFLEVLALCGFLVVFFALVRRRTNTAAATVLTLLIGLSPSFAGATDAVLSDLPYLFFAFLTLWWMDRCRLRGLLDDRRRLVVLGLLLAFTYNVRREGMTLVLALVTLHVVVLAGTAMRARSLRALGDVDWRKVALPYVTFAGAVIAFFLVLPTAVRPTFPGAGLRNVSFRATYYRDVLAEHFGLKDPGNPMRLLGSTSAARQVLALLVILAVVGVVGRLMLRPAEDVTLATFVVSSSFLMLISPYEASRYLFTISPLLAYFAYQSLPTLASFVEGRDGARLVRGASVLSATALAGLMLLNAGDLSHSTRYHLDYSYTENGPETPQAQEMLAAVRERTRGDDVILFFRARAMTLYTDRLALQGSDLTKMLKRVDWYVMAKNSTYSQTLLTDAEAAALGLTKAWDNAGWVIWRVAPRAP